MKSKVCFIAPGTKRLTIDRNTDFQKLSRNFDFRHMGLTIRDTDLYATSLGFEDSWWYLLRKRSS